MTPGEAKDKLERGREEYSRERPHSSLAYRTPQEYARGGSELTSGTVAAALPPDRPCEGVDRRTVLAVRGSLPPRPEGTPLTPPCRSAAELGATGGSGGMAGGS